MKTLIIDNYDSMTFKLFQYVGEINGEEPMVVRNDEVDWGAIESLDIDNIIISSGPGRPERAEDFGISRSAILYARIPLLAVCLGHQGIGHLFGGTVQHLPEPTHGRANLVYHDGQDLFQGIPSPFSVVRYHSLIVDPKLPDTLEVQAKTADGLIMALRCRSRPLWGVQFHPESVCTEFGKQVLTNFRHCTERSRRCSGIAIPGNRGLVWYHIV
ncbi:MAG: anthranilate synthase component II [Gammaproteobacteria bacterium]